MNNTGPRIEVFRSSESKTLYRVGTTTNSKKLIFDAAELAALGSQIQQVLGRTHDAASTA